MILYHGTAGKNKERIKNEGIRPAASAPDTMEAHACRYTVAKGSTHRANPNYVYLSELPHKPIGYGYFSAMGYTTKRGKTLFHPIAPDSDNVVIFEVDSEDLNPLLLRSGSLDTGETAYEGSIVPRGFFQFAMTDEMAKFGHDCFSLRLKNYHDMNIIEYLRGKHYDLG